MAAICLCILLGAFSLELFPQLPPAGFLLLCVTAALLLQYAALKGAVVSAAIEAVFRMWAGWRMK